MPSLHPRLKVPQGLVNTKALVVDATVGITKNQGCNYIMLLCLNLHRTTKKIVSHCHHKEDKHYCSSHCSGSLKQRRSYRNFFYTPTHSHRIRPTLTKSNRNWIIVQGQGVGGWFWVKVMELTECEVGVES